MLLVRADTYALFSRFAGLWYVHFLGCGDGCGRSGEDRRGEVG